MRAPAENTTQLDRSITKERSRLLETYRRATAKPMAVLGFVWLGLIIVRFTMGPNPAVADATRLIWIIFLVDFAARFVLATKKLRFLKRNVLTAISLALPAVRIFAVGRVFAVLPAWQVPLLQMLGSMNRSLVALQSTMERRGLGFVLALTGIVTFAGAAGMYNFERDVAGPGLHSYGGALWWTAMLMTTLGSDYFPHTVPGRLLCFLLAVFAFSIFGYITAAIASYFVNKDADDSRSPIPNEQTLKQVLQEVKALRLQIAELHGEKSESAA
ncbi:MAG: two pore domain potassium channel family protein [Candidatus Eremiobacteraeota bacterium]|nr:two pore domain potassium channel family protein [Candidatus Eremiobacteraeota bacterium]MBV8367194.1 two pore domain potassium channel family protein [Candidatus Eremiobacteraeota bacterium]